MVFNPTLNNISIISWQSVLCVEETGVPGENRWHVASHWQTFVSSTHRLSGIRTHNFNGGGHCLQSQIPHDHDHDEPFWRTIFLWKNVFCFKITLIACLCVRVGILLTYEEHLHNRINSLREKVWAHKTSSTPRLFI